MSPRSSVRSFAIALACVFSMSPVVRAADAGEKIRFNVPAESLGKALREFAVQAKRNISYQPAKVSGKKSAAVKGEYSRSDALSLLLEGSALTTVDLNADTMEVVNVAEGGMRPAEAAHAEGVEVIQFADVPSRDSSDQRDLEEITVTGSHIRGVTSASEAIEIGREEIDRSGYTSLADLMLSLPENFGGGYNAGTGVMNNQVNGLYTNNPSGASVPNLRGLGPGSTLTLIDGRRMASGLAQGGADISSIPIDAIERIEVVTDSASAVYGSDAVAGVINVILKKNFTGATSSLSYGRATQGGGTEKRVSQLLGDGWGSGSVTLAVEHSDQDILDSSQRGFTSQSLSPTSLLPGLRTNSATLSASQQVTPSINGFVDGLYVSRDVDYFRTTPYFPDPQEYPTTFRKYSAASGVDVDLPQAWKGSVSLTVSEDFTDDQSFEFTEPVRSPILAEQIHGFSRGTEVNANGPLRLISAFPVGLAVGAGYRRESFSDLQGSYGGPLLSAATGGRDIRYGFGELSVPIVDNGTLPGLRRLEFTVSGRIESYSDVGTSTVPKLGVIYGPSDSLKLRSTWGKAFRAPNLSDLNGVHQLVILDLANPASSMGVSPVLLPAGGNPTLKPETARAWSVGADWTPTEIKGLQVSATAFEVRYTNRIADITNLYAALTDPLNGFFVTRSPSQAVSSTLYNSYPSQNVYNETGGPFDPASIAAIVDSRQVNVASQTARGADLTASYRLSADSNEINLFTNGSYLSLTQKNTPDSPAEALAGKVFYPPRLRVRSGATWTRHDWALTGTVNWLAKEDNDQVTPSQSVASWTTIDTTLRYSPSLQGAWSGLHVTLSAINLFDRSPPFVQPSPIVLQGLNYDVSNTSPLGRYVRLQMSKSW